MTAPGKPTLRALDQRFSATVQILPAVPKGNTILERIDFLAKI
jgi:hypothetical protein